jgi:dihydrofolate reductase
MAKIALIAAVSKNGAIGANNSLLWHLPGDLKYFKSTTMGKPIVMGRVTFESIGRPLHGRTNIVVTSRKDWTLPDIVVCPSFDEAIDWAQKVAVRSRADEIMVIGGEQIYRQAMPIAQRLYLTMVDDTVQGHAYFPDFDRQLWRQKSLGTVAAENGHPSYSYVVLDRKSP